MFGGRFTQAFIRLAACLALLASASLALPGTPALAALSASSGSCGRDLTYKLEGQPGDLHLTVEGTGDMTSYTWLQRSSEITQVSLPVGLTSICDNAFYRCTALNSIEVPEGVTRIGSNAFFGCYSLTTVDLPSTLRSIGGYAFANTGVSYLHFKGPQAEWASGKLSLEGFAYGDVCLRELSFGEGITEVPLDALAPMRMALTSVSVPASATSVAADLLDSHTTVATFHYAGTEEEWGRVALPQRASNPIKRTKVVCGAKPDTRHGSPTSFAVANGGGSIVPEGCSDATEAIAYQVRPNAGYEIEYARIDGVLVDAADGYLVGGDGKDHALYVRFKQAPDPEPEPDPTTAESPATPNAPATPTSSLTPDTPEVPDEDLPDPNRSGHAGNPATSDRPSEPHEEDGESDPSQTHSGNPSAPPQRSEDIRVPDDAPPEPGWKETDGTWSYLSPDTMQPLTGWQEIEGETYFFTPEGSMVVGWQYLEGNWYHFAPNGAMERGWIFDGTWYYLSNMGVMQTGWLYRDGSWYYLQPGGAIATGWMWDGSWYYFDPSGSMHTGWLCRAGFWYYLAPNGPMVSGWAHIDGDWYYFRPNGSMLSDAWLWEDAWYYFNSAGAWVR